MGAAAPGLVRHSIEFRDLNEATLVRLGSAVRERAAQIARDTGTPIDIKLVSHDPPALATPEIQRQIEAAAASLGLRSQHLPSGAGHDAQFLAMIGPMDTGAGRAEAQSGNFNCRSTAWKRGSLRSGSKKKFVFT